MRDEFIPKGELVKWGRGYKTAFDLFDLYSIALFKECVDYGLSRKVAKKFMEYVNWNFIINTKKHYMVVQYLEKFFRDDDGKEKKRVLRGPWFMEDLEEIIDSEVSQIGFYVDLNKIMENVNNRI